MAASSSEARPSGRAPGSYWAVAALACSLWSVALLALFAGRQAPIGAIRGRLVSEETGRPIAGAQLFLAPADSSVPGRHRRLAVDGDGRFHLRSLHAGEYVVKASSRAHHLREMRVTIAEGETLHLALEMAAMNPFLDVYAPQHVFLPGEPVMVTAHGFIRAESLAVETFSIDPMRVMRDARGSLWRVLAPDTPDRWGQPEMPIPLRRIPGLTLVADSSVAPPRDAEGVFTRRIAVPVKEPGLYLVACRADGVERLNWVMVTDLGLITKRAGPECLLYAVDLASGKPASAEVTLLDGTTATASGRCGTDGLLSLPVRASGDSMLAFARRGESLAFVRVWTGEGSDHGQQRLFIYTDRPVYRPGQRVSYKAIARDLIGQDMRPPQPQPVHVEVRDPRNTLVHSGDTRSSDLGSFDGAFELSPEAATGSYTLVAGLAGNRHEHTFSVASYRKPEYSVDVRPERGSYTRGQSGWFNVEARYFFGAPVVGATVQYTVMRSPVWPWMDGGDEGEVEDEGLDYGEGPGEGEVVAEGEARTDAQGRCLVRFETELPEPASEQRDELFEQDDYDYRYSIEATVSDQGRFTSDGSATVKVWRGELAVAMDPDCFILAPGKPLSAAAVVRDHAGAARAGVPVELSLVRRRWQGDHFTLVTAGKASARTDAEGRASAELRPSKPGDYQARALVRDDHGNEIPASAWVWVTGSTPDQEMPRGASLRVVADRKEYQPGDIATFVIHSSMVGATALVSAEADRILSHQTISLTGQATTFSIPIAREHMPNFQLSVCCVRDKEFVHRQIPVRVSKRPWALQVDVAADRETYAPGDTATYKVRTRDHSGRPVSAEVSLGIVDESIYAIQEDDANILAAFYPRRYSRVSTEFSFPNIYLSGGDKSGMPENVRKEFPDTALWLPSLRTDARGEATVTLKIPDSLTAWRATARAHTRETLVGQTASKVTCRKELMVRIQAPRSLTARDTATVSAMVHNESGAERHVRVTMQARGVSIEGDAERRFSLRPGQVERLDWKVSADAGANQRGPEACRLVASAQADGGLRDAVEQRIPILPHGRARRESVAGSLAGDGTAEERIVMRPDTTGVMHVGLYLAPSLASGMLSSLEYLAHYPYGCTEQTLSAFLPDLVVHRAMGRLGVTSERLERTLPKMVNTGLQRLYRFQHEDGGWGWWEHDRSDVEMTAYVVEGILTAQREGFAVNPDALKRGVEWLLGRERDWVARGIPRLGSPQRIAYGAPPDETPAAFLQAPTRTSPSPLIPPQRAEALLALARAGSAGVVAAAFETPDGAPGSVQDTATLARLCLAAEEAGRTGELDRLRRRLADQAQESSAFCHWNNDPEATALALQALLGVHYPMVTGDRLVSARYGPMEPKIARWLLAQREGDHWLSTWATSRVLFALVDYLCASHEMSPSFVVTPRFNGRALKPARFARADLFRPETRLEVPAEWVRPGENLLRLEKQGAGNLYYTLRLRQYSGQDDVPALLGNSGITVGRTYHLLRPGRDPDTGSLRLVPSEKPVTRLRTGQSYLGRIVIRSPRAYEHMVVEEPIPAGCEPLDRGRVGEDEWDHWWTEVDVRDSQIAFFARELPSGRQVLEYYVRAAVPGRYHVMPTEVSAMYDPSVRGGGSETRVDVR